MKGLSAALRCQVVLQARNGFYWATLFLVVVAGGLLQAIPPAARTDRLTWVPAVLIINTQITTFFFVTGLMLLERDEGTLTALAVSPLSAGAYLAAQTITLTTLAAVETLAIVWLGFGMHGSWLPILLGSAVVGVIYTGFGAVLACRYHSVNALVLPATVSSALLLLPLLPHFGLAPRVLFLLHPVEPPLVLLRAGFGGADHWTEMVFASAGSFAWGAAAFAWGRSRVHGLMRRPGAGGAR